jgi:D-alanine-D-alanine ligase
MAPRSLNVAVLCGGRSSEHDVSLASGAAVRDGLRAAGHAVLDVRIGRDGVWRCDGEREMTLAPGRGLPGADVAFPVLHGPFGEDGTIQGLLECLGIPYVGAGVASSAVCLDKILFKELMGLAGLPQVRYLGVRHPRWQAESATVLAEAGALRLPVFVKPARQGSSVGIARVTEAESLRAALEEAFAHDPHVIVEAAAPGLEVECSVLGRWDDEIRTSLPGEIVLGGGWYDYRAKYEPGGMELVVPARISATATARVRELAAEAFARAGADGLARVDFFVDGETVLLNELNTMPGFTATSVYAKLFDAAGIEYPELLDRLCALALERAAVASVYGW